MNYKKSLKYQTSMREHFQDQSQIYKNMYEKYKDLARKALDKLEFERDMNHAGTKELQFKNMKVEYLLSIFDEIESFTDDPLVKGVIKNARKRNNLDTLIHTRQIFKS